MFGVGLITSAVSAITGIGSQAAAAPMIEFLLGFDAQKSKGTAIAFTLFASSSAAIAAWNAGVKFEFAEAALVALGAFVGAILSVRLSLDPNLKRIRSAGQVLGGFLALYVLLEGVRHRTGGPEILSIGSLSDNRVVLALLVGILTGSLSQFFHLASGIFLVPILLYTRAHSSNPIPEAIAISLTVIGLAAFLPALAHSARKAVDQSIAPFMVAGGVIGGIGGGILLGRLSQGNTLPLIIFGLVAMYLCSYTLYRASTS